MKIIFLILCFYSLVASADNVSIYPIYQSGSNNSMATPPGMYGGMGIGMYPAGGYGGNGIGGGAYGSSSGYSNNPGNPNGSLGFYDATSANKYNVVRPNSDCPLLTQSAKDDQDVFSDLQNYFNSFSQKAECAQDNFASMNGKMAISQLERMLNTTNDQGTKCYSKNVSQISNRNMALYYLEKDMEISMSSPYYSCNQSVLSGYGNQAVSKDAVANCISEKYQQIVELNLQTCKEVVAPEHAQEMINKGMVDLERILINSLSQKGTCAPSPQETFKMTMNTFLKVKSLSVVGPWGAVAGFGADLIGTLLDKFFPSDSQKASNLLSDILSENNFEQNACLYYNIQQKMYCADSPFTVNVPQAGCNRIEVNSELVKLMNQVKSLKSISDSTLIASANNGFATMPGANNSFAPSGLDTAKLENKIEDITKFAKASEVDIRQRIKLLPKVQQAKELEKINRLYNLLNQYQDFDVNNPSMINDGQKALEGLVPLLLGDSNQRINFDDLILKSTPGVQFDALKQSGIASAVESLLANGEMTLKENTEKSRSMAKYNKYKNAMGEIAQSQFRSRLEKQFEEFKKQSQFVSKKDNGVVNDLVSEGILRNIVRHCSLMQEIYDPNIDGNIPDECQKLNCGNENRLNWFQPKKGQNNFSEYKKKFCEKNISYKKIEDSFIKELKDPTGAKVCGKKLADFF